MTDRFNDIDVGDVFVVLKVHPGDGDSLLKIQYPNNYGYTYVCESDFEEVPFVSATIVPKLFEVGDWVLVQTDDHEYVTKVTEVFWQENQKCWWYNYGPGMSGSRGHNLTKMVKA